MASNDYRMTIDWKWLAGFTEGEAAIYFYRYEGRRGITCGISWEQTVDNFPSLTMLAVRDFLQRRNYIISERRHRSANGGRWRHRVSIQNQTDVIRVVKKLIPLLGDKREHAEQVLAQIQEWQEIGGRKNAVGRDNSHMRRPIGVE